MSQPPQYRMLPARMGAHFTIVACLAALGLGTPIIAALGLPPHSAEVEALALESEGYPFSVNTSLDCEITTEMAPYEGWYCGNTAVTEYLLDGVEDSDRALRRTVRYVAYLHELPSGAIIHAPGASLLVDHDTATVAMGVHLTEQEAADNPDLSGAEIHATLTGGGQDLARTTAELWHARTGQDLPEDVFADIMTIGAHEPPQLGQLSRETV